MNILDLPDEILQFIFNKLSTIDIFYSLINVNERFARIARDSLYVNHLDFSIKSSNHCDHSVYDDILNQICSKVLPRINEKVTKLTVDQYSMKHIIDAVDYPQLHSLSLVQFQAELLSRLVTGRYLLVAFDFDLLSMKFVFMF